MQAMFQGSVSSMKLHGFFLFAFFLLFSSAVATDFSYCTKRLYEVKVEEVHVVPDPVVAGKPATFNISASTDDSISGGKVLIAVSYFGVHVHSETRDLCQEVSCPISAGNFVLSHTQSLPGFTPPGSYTLRMTIVGNNNHELTCLSFRFKIGFGSLVFDD